ncbi:MAG: T9SS type A sorting domain-containing protein, partial [Muribaculaceae bacterium]
LTSKVSTKAGEKNIFLGFDATWTAPAALDGYTISYKLTHSAGSVDIPAGTTTTTLYGANAGDISLQAVYTSNSDPNLIYFSEIVKAPYIPINVLEPANITEIKDKKRYDIDGVYTATLNWAVTTTNPIAHYLVKYADATKAGAITYKEFYGAERNYPFTGLQNMTVGQDKTTSQADGSMSKLAENPTGVIVNYLIVPGYRIGNTIKQKIVDADYSDATIATVNYPTALTGMKSTTFTVDMQTLTGVEGIEVGKVAIYPNPTTGQVTIALNSEISTVAVYSLSGALVRNIDGNGEVTMPCDFSDLASGVYFVKVNNCNPTKVIIK